MVNVQIKFSNVNNREPVSHFQCQISKLKMMNADDREDNQTGAPVLLFDVRIMYTEFELRESIEYGFL